MGKMFVIEGVDGSGKATHTEKLYKKLLMEGFYIKKVEYPNYDSDSSALVKMYLNGCFGSVAKDVSPYIASTFYAADRYASFKTEYENFYNNGGIVLADRYTTANMVHQAGKISNKEEREKFLDWLWEYEFNLYGLPIPDLVFFLDIPPEFNEKLMEGRDNKFTGEAKKDIHESDASHLLDSYNSAKALVSKYSWVTISCIKDGSIRTVEDIHEEIYQICKEKISEERNCSKG